MRSAVSNGGPAGKENVAIVGVEPIGNYAIQIVFDDGHDTGLFSWDYLRGLAQLRREGAVRAPIIDAEKGGRNDL